MSGIRSISWRDLRSDGARVSVNVGGGAFKFPMTFSFTSRTTIDSASVIRRFTTLSRTDRNTGLPCSLAMPVQATWPVCRSQT